MPFKEKKEGTTHSYNDGCGEPEHNDMKITSPTQVCPECKKTHCKHYDHFDCIRSILARAIEEERQRIKKVAEGMNPNERKVASYDKYEAVTYEEKMLVADALDNLIKQI